MNREQREWLISRLQDVASVAAPAYAQAIAAELPSVFPELAPGALPMGGEMPAVLEMAGPGALDVPDLPAPPQDAEPTWPALSGGAGPPPDFPAGPPAAPLDLPAALPPLPGGLAEFSIREPPAEDVFPPMQPQLMPDGSVVFSDNRYAPPEPPGLPPQGPNLDAGPSMGDLFGLLEQVAVGMQALTASLRGRRVEQGMRGLGIEQFQWSGRGFGDPAEEDFAPASPSVNVTSLSGRRGAGGWGFGSRGMGNSPVDLYEPARRTGDLG